MDQTNGVDWSSLNLEVEVTKKEHTGFRVYKVVDAESGISVHFVEFNSELDAHTGPAWVAAQTSRTSKSYEELFEDLIRNLNDNEIDPGDKLAKVFVNYGHASVGDMVPISMYIENIPIFIPFLLFNKISVGAGQELSTRFVNFNDFGIRPIEELIDLSSLDEASRNEVIELWDKAQTYLKEKYTKWYTIIKNAYEKQFGNEEDPLKESTVNARTLDIVRYFIPAGARTSMAFSTSVRGFVDLISKLREYPNEQVRRLADQIHATLSLSNNPECADIKANLDGLTKHSHPRMIITNNLNSLKSHLDSNIEFQTLLSQNVERSDSNTYKTESKLLEWTDPGTPVVMQYILSLFPNIGDEVLIKWLDNLSEYDKEKLGEIIFAGHDHHNLMQNMGDVRGDIMFSIMTSLASLRDINRHRALGRLIPMLETTDFREILSNGGNQNYQIHNTDELRKYAEEFDFDLSEYYVLLNKLYDCLSYVPGFKDNQSIMFNLIPLGHQSKLYLSGPISQLIYMLSLRSMPGGDQNYRDLMHQIANHLLGNSNFFSSIPNKLATLDPNNRDDFTNRK